MSYQDPPDWQEILTYFRGSELQNYFTKILEDDLKAIVKPQYVDQIPRTVQVSSRPSNNQWFMTLGLQKRRPFFLFWLHSLSFLH